MQAGQKKTESPKPTNVAKLQGSIGKNVSLDTNQISGAINIFNEKQAIYIHQDWSILIFYVNLWRWNFNRLIILHLKILVLRLSQTKHSVLQLLEKVEVLWCISVAKACDFLLCPQDTLCLSCSASLSQEYVSGSQWGDTFFLFCLFSISNSFINSTSTCARTEPWKSRDMTKSGDWILWRYREFKVEISFTRYAQWS